MAESLSPIIGKCNLLCAERNNNVLFNIKSNIKLVIKVLFHQDQDVWYTSIEFIFKMEVRLSKPFISLCCQAKLKICNPDSGYTILSSKGLACFFYRIKKRSDDIQCPIHIDTSDSSHITFVDLNIQFMVIFLLNY